jgi:hypothetical protein
VTLLNFNIEFLGLPQFTVQFVYLLIQIISLGLKFLNDRIFLIKSPVQVFRFLDGVVRLCLILLHDVFVGIDLGSEVEQILFDSVELGCFVFLQSLSLGFLIFNHFFVLCHQRLDIFIRLVTLHL